MYYEIIFDTLRNIKTSKNVNIKDLSLKIHNTKEIDNYRDYNPTNPYLLARIFTFLANNYNLDQMGFIDFGAGKGRVVSYAYNYNFKKIIGIEFAEELFKESITNLAGLSDNKTPPTLIHMDATLFDIRDELNVFYFFNPFIGDVMKEVLKNIDKSYLLKQRDLLIVYVKTK